MSLATVLFRTLSRVASSSRAVAVSGAAQPAILPVGAQLAGAGAACPGPFCRGEAAVVQLGQSGRHVGCAWDKFGFHGRVVAWAAEAVMRRADGFLTHGVTP